MSAGAVGVAPRDGAASSGASRFDERKQFACEAVLSGSPVGSRRQFSVNQQFAGAGGVAPRAGAVSASSIDLAERGHFAGCAGRHGEEQRAPGGWRALRPLPGALRQVRKFHRRVSENLSTLSSSLVPHARLFSLHLSLVSQNSSLSHGLGAMNSCGFMHGVDMHDNSFVVHEKSCSAVGHKNSCSSHAAGVQGGTKASSMSTRLGVEAFCCREACFSTADVSKVACRGVGRPFAEPRSEILSGGGNRAGVCCFGGLSFMS